MRFSTARLYGWGFPSSTGLQSGECGSCYGEPILFAMPNEPQGRWSKVFSGTHTAYALSTNGFLHAFGDNREGLLGNGTRTDAPTMRPSAVDSLERFATVASGSRVTSALTTDGRLFTWGSNEAGATGLDITEGHQLVPTQVGDDDDWAMLAAGGARTFALKKSGALYGFGDNLDGLGLGANLDDEVHTPTFLRAGVRAVFAKDRVAHVITFDGELFALGDGSDGSLGFGDNEPRDTFTRVGEARDWTSLSYGTDGNVIATKADGSVHVWGPNLDAQLGFGDSFPRPTPTVLPSVRWR